MLHLTVHLGCTTLVRLKFLTERITPSRTLLGTEADSFRIQHLLAPWFLGLINSRRCVPLVKCMTPALTDG